MRLSIGHVHSKPYLFWDLRPKVPIARFLYRLLNKRLARRLHI